LSYVGPSTLLIIAKDLNIVKASVNFFC